MNYKPIKTDDLFSDYEDIPSENDPFCNFTENTAFNESYSEVIPAFFFRNKKCSLHPGRYEKKKLKYFYNTTGVILSAKLIIEVSACILFYILMFLGSFAFTPSLSLYYSALSDSTVQYSFKTIAVILSTISVFFAGCRYSSLSPAGLLKGNRKIKTIDIITFFMTGLFIASVQNILDFFLTYYTDSKPVIGIHLEKDILQITIASIYTCIIAPVADGIIFRGLVLKNLSRASQHFGIIMSSFLCALSAGSFHKMIPAFMLAVILSKLTVKYNTLIPAILIHITINISNMIISIYGTLAWESDIYITKLWTAITFVTGGIFAVISVIKSPAPKINSLQRRRTYALFFGSFCIILIIILYFTAAAADFIAFMYF